MLERILKFSIQQRWVVLLIVLGMAALGVYNYQRLPIDAVPDITNVQVQINTEAPGYSPLEAEQRITFSVETAMAGLPFLEQTRSLSRYGLSQVTVIFKDGTDIYFARQLVNERIQEVKGQLPPGIEPSMGPIASGLGEIFMCRFVGIPKFKNANELRLRVDKLGMRAICRFARICWTLSGLLNTQVGGNDHHFAQAAMMLCGDQHARQLHVNRPLGHLSANIG